MKSDRAFKESPTSSKVSARRKLLDAALGLVRTQGYEATTVDDLCEAAGVTKGAFFHHFESKEALAIAAADHWSEVTEAVFRSAPYRAFPDPLARVLGYVEFRRELIRGEIPEYTCLVGTMVQEIFGSHPKIRAACERSIFGHAADVAQDISEAKRKYAPNAEWSADGLAVYTQAALQGAFILSKAKDDPAVAIECVDHLHRYIKMLFPLNRPKKEGNS